MHLPRIRSLVYYLPNLICVYYDSHDNYDDIIVLINNRIRHTRIYIVGI